MYAVVSSGGKQYRVEPGTTLTMERLGAGAGEPFTFDRVLLIGDGDEVTVGTPVVSGASVSATILGEELGPKLVIFKFKQKVKYRRRTGHRQHLMRVRIDAINANGKSARAEAPKAEAPRKPASKAQTSEKAAPRASRSRTAKPEKTAAPKAKASEAASTDVPEAEKPKARTRRKPSTAAAKETSASKASASEEKPKPKRTTRPKPSAKKTQEQQ